VNDRASDAALREALTNLLDRPATPETLAEHARHAAEPRADQREDLTALLAVRIGTEWFALPAARVIHVGPAVIVHRVPHRSRPGFRGLANVDGRIVPVADLGRLLGIAPAQAGDSATARVVLFGETDAPWACIVDEAPGMASIAEADAESPPLTVSEAPDSITSGLVETQWGRASKVDMTRLEHLVSGLGA
jgi:chemotaxis-related protein WspD